MTHIVLMYKLCFLNLFDVNKKLIRKYSRSLISIHINKVQYEDLFLIKKTGLIEGNQFLRMRYFKISDFITSLPDFKTSP